MGYTYPFAETSPFNRSLLNMSCKLYSLLSSIVSVYDHLWAITQIIRLAPRSAKLMFVALYSVSYLCYRTHFPLEGWSLPKNKQSKGFCLFLQARFFFNLLNAVGNSFDPAYSATLSDRFVSFEDWPHQSRPAGPQHHSIWRRFPETLYPIEKHQIECY